MLRRLGPLLQLDRARARHAHAPVVTTAVWRWRHEKAPMERCWARRRRGAGAGQQRRLRLAAGSGKAEQVEGGFKISGRKIFASGVAGGDLLMTWPSRRPRRRPQVLHFAVPLDAPGREAARQLAHARHARHRLERHRASRRSSCPRRRSACAGRRASGARSCTSITCNRAAADLFGLSRHRRSGARHRPRPGDAQARDGERADAGRRDGERARRGAARAART